MKTNLPGRKLFLLVVCVAIMALTLNSCRKDLLVANSKDIAMAQQWYQQRALTVKNYVYLKGGNLIPIEEKPDWGGAKKTVLGNGSSVIIVPLESNLFKATGQQGSLQLVIEEKQGEFRSRYVGSKNPETFEKPAKELFQMAFLDKQEPGPAKGSPSAAGGQYQSLQVNCTDWYLVTKVYVDDELVSVKEEYLGTTCDGEFTGGGSGSNGGGNGDGNFGEDANCRNCVVSADNFLALKAYARAAGLTVYPAFASTLTLVDGTQYTGIFVEIRAANGTLVVTYFSPNENSSLFTTGYYYSIGNKGPSGTNNPPNIVSPNGAIWNFGATPSQVGGGWGSQSATYGRAPEFQHLINVLGLSTTEVVFLDNLPKVVDALNIYLQTYGEGPENVGFLKWAVGYLKTNNNISLGHLEGIYQIQIDPSYIPRDREPSSYYWRTRLSDSNGYDNFGAYLVETTPYYIYLNGQKTINLEAYNCHYYAFGLTYASEVAAELPKWVLNVKIDTKDWELVKGRVKVGDRIIYQANTNGRLAFTHSAVVTEVDADGYATKAKSKMSYFEIIEHHPRDMPVSYGSTNATFTIDVPAAGNNPARTETHQSRLYWRKK